MELLENIFSCIHPDIVRAISCLDKYLSVTEIRLGKGREVIVSTAADTIALRDNSGRNLICTEDYFAYSVNALSGGSLYSIEGELRQGFVTIKGGHRVGICATALMNGREVSSVVDLSSLCFRAAREIKGCALALATELTDGGEVCSSLVASPPGYGKTTVLRDICRILGSGCTDAVIRKVGIADERGEIAAMHRGVPSFDIGIGSFVWDGCRKSSAILAMLRSMSPHVIVTDEIGTGEDFEAVSTATKCGVGIIAGVHARDIEDLGTRFGKGLRYFDKVFFINNKKPGYKMYRRCRGDY